MKILLVHNRYRSGAPSGENRVVEQESAALAALGHEVTRFDRGSDEIEQWPLVKKATLPARIVWNPETFRDLRAALRAQRPDVVHVHNTFPLLSAAVLHACRAARVPVVATIHNYKLTCANGAYFRDGAVCHDCAEGKPLSGLRHGCYRDSVAATAPVATAMVAHRRAWRSLVSAYIFISRSQRDLLRGFRFPEDRVFVKYNLIPFRERPQVPKSPLVVYAGRLDEPKGVRILMAGWDRYLQTSGDPGLRLAIAGSGPLGEEVAAWAAARPSVTLTGSAQQRGLRGPHLQGADGPPPLRVGGDVRPGRRGVHGRGSAAHRGGPRVIPRAHHPPRGRHAVQPGRSGGTRVGYRRRRAEPGGLRGVWRGGPQDL